MWYNIYVIKGRKTLNKPMRERKNTMANMTEREFLTAVLAIAGLPENLATYATEGIAKLDARNDKRKNTQSKAQKENEGVMDTIYNTLVANGSMVASEIASALGISTQKASALCKLLVDGKRVTVADVKVKNKGTVKQYTAVPSDTDEGTDEVTDEVTE